MATVFKRTFDFFSKVWQTTIRPFIGWAWRQVQRLHTWLEKTLAPALNFLKSVRAWILDHYDHWLRPIFQAIDATHQTLELLEAFHVPFARKLDAWLTAFEDKVNEKIGYALTRVNEAINWIDRIVSIDGTFQRLTLIQSQWKYVGDTWAVLLKHQPAGVSSEENAALHRLEVPVETPRHLAGELEAYDAAGAGELAPIINELTALSVASSK